MQSVYRQISSCLIREHHLKCHTMPVVRPRTTFSEFGKSAAPLHLDVEGESLVVPLS